MALLARATFGLAGALPTTVAAVRSGCSLNTVQGSRQAQIVAIDPKEEMTIKDWKDRIDLNPEVLAGKPVVKGTRLAVEFIIDLLAQGWTEEAILSNYPGLTHDDIKACLKYASDVLHAERVYPLRN